MSERDGKSARYEVTVQAEASFPASPLPPPHSTFSISSHAESH